MDVFHPHHDAVIDTAPHHVDTTMHAWCSRSRSMLLNADHCVHVGRRCTSFLSEQPPPIMAPERHDINSSVRHTSLSFSRSHGTCFSDGDSGGNLAAQARTAKGEDNIMEDKMASDGAADGAHAKKTEQNTPAEDGKEAEPACPKKRNKVDQEKADAEKNNKHDDKDARATDGDRTKAPPLAQQCINKLGNWKSCIFCCEKEAEMEDVKDQAAGVFGGKNSRLTDTLENAKNGIPGLEKTGEDGKKDGGGGELTSCGAVGGDATAGQERPDDPELENTDLPAPYYNRCLKDSCNLVPYKSPEQAAQEEQELRGATNGDTMCEGPSGASLDPACQAGVGGLGGLAGPNVNLNRGAAGRLIPSGGGLISGGTAGGLIPGGAGGLGSFL
eukprot:GEMP01061128.1.p1 GENE.GEMP01061128.1~~GEMP01061128.1.p1  ORF type:complete len:439 (+),score=109.36 GEMP01061128.1:160-1317(+)